MRKKLISILTALIMCIGMLPMTAFAEIGGEPEFYAREIEIDKKGQVNIDEEKLTEIELTKGDSIDIVVFSGKTMIEANSLNLVSVDGEVSEDYANTDYKKYAITISLPDNAKGGTISYNDYEITVTKRTVVREYLFYREVTEKDGELQQGARAYGRMNYTVGDSADVIFYYGNPDNEELKPLQINGFTVDDETSTALTYESKSAGFYHLSFNSEADGTLSVGSYEMDVVIEPAEAGVYFTDKYGNELEDTFKLRSENDELYLEFENPPKDMDTVLKDTVITKGSEYIGLRRTESDRLKFSIDFEKIIDNSVAPFVLKVENELFGSCSIEIMIGAEANINLYSSIEAIDNKHIINHGSSGEDTRVYMYDKGDVIYIVDMTDDRYIGKESWFKVKGNRFADAELVKTSKTITLESGETVNRYALKLTIPDNADSDDYTDSYIIECFDKNGNSEKVNISVLYRLYRSDESMAPTGGVEFEYNGKTYYIGFALPDEDELKLLNGSINSYDKALEGQEGNSDARVVKILSMTRVDYGGDVIEEYKEEKEMYAKIDSFKAMLASYDYDLVVNDDAMTGYYPADSNDIYNSDSFRIKTVSAYGDYPHRRYAEVVEKRIEGKVFLVGTVTFKDGQTVKFSHYYKAIPIEESVLDLTDNDNWGLEDINSYIEKAQSVNCDNIVIKLNPERVYGGDADEIDTLVLMGNKPVVIEGNGAVIKGKAVTMLDEDEKAVFHQLNEIHFVSNIDGIDNENDIAISGQGQVSAGGNSFDGYYAASLMIEESKYDDGLTGFKLTPSHCTFTNNKYGIYLKGDRNYPNGGRYTNYVIENCLFYNNEIGIYIPDYVDIRDNTDFLNIKENAFISNDMDVVNGGRYPFIVKGCYFGSDIISNLNFTIGDYPYNNPRAPRTEGVLVSFVYLDSTVRCNHWGLIFKVVNSNASAPLKDGGSFDDFAYENSETTDVNVDGFNGKIDVIGDYDMTKDEYKQYGTWDFGEEA